MRARSVLLQLFLIVALLVDGMGVAAASMHANQSMAGEADAPAEAAPQQGVAPEAPCHDKKVGGSAPIEKHAHSGGASPGGDEPQSPADCCESGDCRCACMHHCQAAVVAIATTGPTPEHGAVIESMSSALPSLALPQLIRPPIG